MIRFLLVISLASAIWALPTCQDVNFTGKLTNHTIISGYTPNGEKDQGTYYIFYGALNTSAQELSKKPVIVYIEGGPGLTSFVMNLEAFGPYELSKPENGSLKMSPRNINDTWNSNYSLLFIDQPVGTGAAAFEKVTKYVNTTLEAAQQVNKTLEDFFMNCFSKVVNSSEVPSIILQGHSYGGKTALALTQIIIESNSTFKSMVKGVMAVSPALDIIQNVKQSGVFAYNMGLIDFWERPKIEQGIIKALNAIKAGKFLDALKLIKQNDALALKLGGGLSKYNIRQYAKDANASIYLSITKYFRDTENCKAFNIDPSVKFVINNDEVENSLSADLFQSAVPSMEVILNNSTISLIVIQGQDDALINIPAQILTIDSVNWINSESFNNQDFSQWKVGEGSNATTVGYYKSFGKYEYRSINKAGHSTYIDQPQIQTLANNLFISSVLSEKKKD